MSDINLGYWTPVYGGFLRNVESEGMRADWDYIREVSVLADRLGFHTTLIPELYLNDRKGVDAPSLEAWALSGAVLAVTSRLRVLTAIRPGFHLPAVAAKTSTTLADIGSDRFAVNVVAAWWEEEARQYGGRFSSHDERYVQAAEFVGILRRLWQEDGPADFHGRYFDLDGTVMAPKPSIVPAVFAGGESEGGREAIAGFADSYVLHGATVDEAAEKVRDLNARRERLQGAPFAEFGMAAYVIVRDTEAEARRELDRITTVDPASPGYASFEEFRRHSQLDVELSRGEYSVGTRGLRPQLVGTAEQVAERIAAYADAGINLLLLQSTPLHEELERIAADVFPLLGIEGNGLRR